METAVPPPRVDVKDAKHGVGTGQLQAGGQSPPLAGTLPTCEAALRPGPPAPSCSRPLPAQRTLLGLCSDLAFPRGCGLSVKGTWPLSEAAPPPYFRCPGPRALAPDSRVCLPGKYGPLPGVSSQVGEGAAVQASRAGAGRGSWDVGAWEGKTPPPTWPPPAEFGGGTRATPSGCRDV